MKKIWLLLAGVALFSCASDDASEAPLTTEGTIMRKAIGTGTGYSGESDYFYNGDKLGKIVETESGSSLKTKHFVYDGNLIVKMNTANGSVSYEYDSSQRLTKITSDDLNVHGYECFLAYNVDGSINTTVYEWLSGSPVLKFTQTLYFENGNLIRKTTHATPNTEEVEHSYVYTYDNHPNPRIHATGMTKLNYDWWAASNPGSANNIVKIMEESDAIPEPVELHHYVRTYNSYGYPVTEQVFKPDGTLDSTVSYYYQ